MDEEKLPAELGSTNRIVQIPQGADDFFMNRFKTLWCPTGHAHDWQLCGYAHNYQDARRNPKMGYGPRPCPWWDKKNRSTDYKERCPNGFLCPFSHGAKEQLYHPGYYKTVICLDYENNEGQGCPRGNLCAFYHTKCEMRINLESGEEGEVPTDENFNYDEPLPEGALEHLQPEFMTPPFGEEYGLPRRERHSFIDTSANDEVDLRFRGPYLPDRAPPPAPVKKLKTKF